MRLTSALTMLLAFAPCLPLWAAEDASRHNAHSVAVEKNVSLEVLDWGGQGTPLIFVAGLGGTAHSFDDFAPKFIGTHHVFGVTRRGYGASTHPAPTDENYDADRLGDDVLAVIDALKLDGAVLAGFSVAGSELSSVGTRHPEKVAALIYLDANAAYAFYMPQVGPPVSLGPSAGVEMSTVRRNMKALLSVPPGQMNAMVGEVSEAIARLQSYTRSLKGAEGKANPSSQERTPQQQITAAIQLNLRKYAAVKLPMLIIAAVPHACTQNCEDRTYLAAEAEFAAQTNAVEAAMPNARVVRIPGADHAVYRSHPTDVEKEMNQFLSALSKDKK